MLPKRFNISISISSKEQKSKFAILTNNLSSLQELHGNGVGLAFAAPGVAAARQDENGRTGVEGRHLDGPIAQIPDELCAAGESVGVYLHDGFFFLLYFYGKGSFFVGRA